MITFVIDDIKRDFYSNKVMYTYRMELTVDEDQMLYIKNAKQEDIDIRGLMKK